VAKCTDYCTILYYNNRTTEHATTTMYATAISSSADVPLRGEGRFFCSFVVVESYDQNRYHNIKYNITASDLKIIIIIIIIIGFCVDLY